MPTKAEVQTIVNSIAALDTAINNLRKERTRLEQIIICPEPGCHHPWTIHEQALTAPRYHRDESGQYVTDGIPVTTYECAANVGMGDWCGCTAKLSS